MEASRRILVDRSAIRLDGRPFFTFGPHLLLTPPEKLKAAIGEIAAAGFTTVVSPPCSPGSLHLMNIVFDAADEAGIMVVLMGDPRLPEHGRYLADQFCHRKSLHSYMLSPREITREGLADFQRERDNIVASDLFHPVSAPCNASQIDAAWLRSQDVYTIIPEEMPTRAATAPRFCQQPGPAVRALTRDENIPQRPVIVPGLRVSISDAERAAGMFADDPWVSRLSPRALDWFPFLANFSTMPRKDLLGPDPEMLRLQVYDALASGARGVLLDFFEAMSGPTPYSGRDRFCEAAILAQEIGLLNDFFAEGRAEPVLIETGHPRLDASVIRHGLDYLIVLRMNGYEEDYFVDEAYMHRTGIDIMLAGDNAWKAWRLDFPAAEALEIQRDRAGAARFLAGSLELTGLVLISAGTQRAQECAEAIQKRLPLVARMVVEQLEVRFAKLLLIEGELSAARVGLNNEERMRTVQKSMDAARELLRGGDFAGAYTKARQGLRFSRQIVKYQMAKALATPVTGGSQRRSLLRGSYYTLPQFYREGASEPGAAFMDLT
ncbi:MAG TPA: hypothetical protein PKH51_05715 [Candidatus Sumerlaeota bacterium]|nr:hypothetical protein [Candidatus Sumerlaeota bacterium]